jgi:hypothetical protein
VEQGIARQPSGPDALRSRYDLRRSQSRIHKTRALTLQLLPEKAALALFSAKDIRLIGQRRPLLDSFLLHAPPLFIKLLVELAAQRGITAARQRDELVAPLCAGQRLTIRGIGRSAQTIAVISDGGLEGAAKQRLRLFRLVCPERSGLKLRRVTAVIQLLRFVSRLAEQVHSALPLARRFHLRFRLILRFSGADEITHVQPVTEFQTICAALRGPRRLTSLRA